jgi:hypothetical protein
MSNGGLNFLGIISGAVDFIMHIDKYMGLIIQTYGFWSYLLLL